MPAAIVLATATISGFGYFASRQMESDLIRPLMAMVLGATYFFSIAFGAVYVYSTAYIRGASFGERILASAITPFVWMTKEVIVLTESYPLIQALYWYLNPLNVCLIGLMMAEMGVVTVFVRKSMKSPWVL